MKIYFHGATGDVTGSAYHVKTKHASVLVDGGLFQDAVVENVANNLTIASRFCRTVSARVSVEKASTLGWARYVGRGGHSIGMDTFGASAPLRELQKKFGFTAENIILAAKEQIAKRR